MASSLDRREFLARLGFGLAALPAVPIVSALGVGAKARMARPPMTVYKSASCGCCKSWVAYMQKAGFTVTAKDVDDLDKIKKDLGVPVQLVSCHTGVIGAYLVEGHVPADVIGKFLAEKPAGARGIAVPGMPQSSPGMDVPGAKDKYDVILFTSAGKTSVYARR